MGVRAGDLVMRRAACYAGVALLLCGMLTLALGACGGGDASSETSAGSVTTLSQVVTSELLDPTIELMEDGSVSLGTRVDPELLGAWYCEELREMIRFGATGTMSSIIGEDAEAEFTFPYRVEGTVIYLIDNGLVVPVFEYSIDGDVLTLVDVDSGAADVYQRVL